VNLEKFTSSLKTLANWYRKSISDDQKAIFYRKLQHIPGEAFEKIIEDIVENSKAFPTINDIKLGYLTWINENKNRITHLYESTPCDECNGTGMLHYRYFDEKYKYFIPLTAACSLCENWKRTWSHKSRPRMATKAELVKEGYELPPYKRNKKSIPIVTVTEMVDSVADEVPF